VALSTPELETLQLEGLPVMNKALIGMLAGGALLASLPAIAQQPAPATPAPAAPTAPAAPAAAKKAPVAIPRNVFLNGQLPGQYLARDRLIGAKVQNREGSIIGDIEDLIVGPNGQIQGVIMGTGGFLGVGEKRIGVLIGALQFGLKDGKQTITLPAATKEVLGALEPFKRAEPKKSILDKAKEKAKELTDKTTETTKDAAKAAQEKAAPVIEKAKEAVKPGTAPEQKK
jgi:hypothetical protein